MFTVEDSSGNDFGNSNNGWEINKQWWMQWDAMVMMARAWAPMVMTPTEHLQNQPMLIQHPTKATGLLNNYEQLESNAQQEYHELWQCLQMFVLTHLFHEMLDNNDREQYKIKLIGFEFFTQWPKEAFIYVIVVIDWRVYFSNNIIICRVLKL